MSDYTESDLASLRRQTWLLDQARGVEADQVSSHGHALRMALMRATGQYARTAEPADFERMQLAAEYLDAYLAGCECAVERYAASLMRAEGVRDAA